VSGCNPTGYYQVVTAFSRALLASGRYMQGMQLASASPHGVYPGSSIEDSAAWSGYEILPSGECLITKKDQNRILRCARASRRRAYSGGIGSCSSSTKDDERLRRRAICHRLQDRTGPSSAGTRKEGLAQALCKKPRAGKQWLLTDDQSQRVIAMVCGAPAGQAGGIHLDRRKLVRRAGRETC